MSLLSTLKQFVSPPYGRIAEKAYSWAGLMAKVSSFQVLTQGITFFAGILIVRRLTQTNYALYTLALSMVTAMNVIAEGGVYSGLMAEGGKAWTDRKALGTVLVTGLTLRRRLGIWAALVCSPLLAWQLHSHGVGWAMVGILIVTLLLTSWLTLLGTLYSISSALHQHIGTLQTIAAIQALLRLASLLAVLYFFPYAWSAIAAGIVPLVWGTSKLRKAARQMADFCRPPDPAVYQSILRVVKHVLPGSIYLCISSQIGIWLVSIYGSTTTLAQIGALSRLGQVFVLLSAIVSALFVPRFARLEASNARVLSRYLQTLGVIVIFGAFIAGSLGFFPQLAVAILGHNYLNLQRDVGLQMLCSLLWFVSAAAYNLGCARGIVVKPLLSIGIQVSCQIVLVAVLKVGTLRGSLWLSTIVGAVQLMIYAGSVIAMLQCKRSAQAQA